MKVFEIEKITYPILIQPKLNGIGFRLERNGYFANPRSDKYYPGQPLAGRKFPFAIYGEFYKHGMPLQEIAGLVGRGWINDLEFHVYDCDISKPTEMRIRILEEWTRGQDLLKMVPTHRVASTKEANALYDMYLAQGYEGIVYRPLPDGEPLKRKPYRDIEVECIGVREGKGKRKGHVGAFICKLGDQIFSVGGGQVDYGTLKELFQNPPVGKMITIRFNSTSVAGIPLCPQFIRVREVG